MYARATGAVPSGRSVRERSPRSVNVYISFWTMSEPCAGRAREEPRVLEERRRDPPVPVERAERFRLADDPLPERLLGGKDVVCASGRLELHEARSSARNGLRAELGAEGRLRAVAGVDDGLRREALHQRLDRLEERVPVAEREIGSPDRAGEEDVAREERALGVVGDVAGRVARNVQRLERDAGELDGLAAVEEDVRLVRPQRHVGKPLGRIRQDRRLLDAACRPSRRCARRGRRRRRGDPSASA